MFDRRDTDIVGSVDPDMTNRISVHANSAHSDPDIHPVPRYDSSGYVDRPESVADLMIDVVGKRAMPDLAGTAVPLSWFGQQVDCRLVCPR